MEGLDTVLRNLDKYQNEVARRVWLTAQEFAPQIEAYAKVNARWTDRTGNARQSLMGYADKDEIFTYLVIAHGVDYGKWLEMVHSGQYGILFPSISTEVQPFLAAVREAVVSIVVKP